jgi:hypothetical protein
MLIIRLAMTHLNYASYNYPATRKFYASLSRIRYWVEEVERQNGGLDPLDPNGELLNVAVFEESSSYNGQGDWEFGRLYRHGVSYYDSALYKVDGESEAKSVKGKLYVCDDVAVVKKLNAAQEKLARVIAEIAQLKKKHLVALQAHQTRPMVVALAKKQRRRVKARARRR